MLEEYGVVVEASDQYAWIQTQRRSACQHCQSNQSCGTASLSQLFGQKVNEVKVVNSLNVNIGDQVVIGIEEQALLHGSLLLYLLPLLTMFMGAISYEGLATQLNWPVQEGFTILAGLIGLGLGLFLIRRWTARWKENAHYQPVLLKKCGG